MSKIKKLIRNPTLFLYDFCAKRLGKDVLQQQIITTLNKLFQEQASQASFYAKKI